MLLNVEFYTIQMLIFCLFPRAKTGSLQKPLSQTYWTSVKSLSLVQVFETSWTVDCQAPPSMGFFRQEYWSGLPFPSPDPGRDRTQVFRIAARIFTIWATREALKTMIVNKNNNVHNQNGLNSAFSLGIIYLLTSSCYFKYRFRKVRFF